ncbi:hypothetical protein [Streptomyces niveus]|uniref:hypothetical protein n=1 Tax=Streptomyces niveus TaxID=193462 RepID=UPI0036D3126C
MPGPRRSAVVAAPLPVGGLLNWSGSAHFSKTARPCWHCGAPTHLRDNNDRPADKVCAERALADVLQVVAAHSEQGRL